MATMNFVRSLSNEIAATSEFVDYEFITKKHLDLSRIKKQIDALDRIPAPAVIWSKEEYLKWVAEWKTLYRVMTRTSRHLKHYRKPNSIREKNSSASWEMICQMADARASELHELSNFATRMMEMRKVSKEKAQSSYLASKMQEAK